MFCPNCGNKLNGNEEFCSSCGTNLKQNNNITLTEQLSHKSKSFIKPLIEKIKQFIIKYKKQLLIGSSTLVGIIVLVILYGSLFGFDRLKWDKDIINSKYVTQSNIKLGINFNKEKLDELKIKTNCGDYERNELKINWNLNDNVGKCKIEVKYKLQKLTKEYTVINPNNEKDLSVDLNINEKIKDDIDQDGLTNEQEKKYNTNEELNDSDMDGLDDYYEIFTSKTDPNKVDTDGDGLSDYDEIELGLDPLKTDSKNDGISDNKRSVTYNLTYDNISLEIKGTGNIATSSINAYKNNTFNEIEGLLDTVYNLYTSGKIDNAVIKIPYSLDEINEKGLTEDDLTLFYFNEETKELESIATTVDKQNKMLIAELNHFSKYVVGDKNTVLKDKSSEIMMVIDNSVSMYTESQLKKLGYTRITGADGNDSNFKRITLTNSLIDMLTGNYHFGISEFAGQYVNLKSFTTDKDSAKKSVNSIKNDIKKVGDGTNIVSALNGGIAEFSVNSNNHYLLLLTDGKDTSNTLNSSKTRIINSAKSKNIKVCVIGLGNNIDTNDLNDIAEQTGCDYYSANNANALDEIYSIIGAGINYNLVDTNKDGKADSTIISDSGFIVTRDGFSFKNYVSNLADGGHCYGMATFAELYFARKLPFNLSSKTADESKSYAYNLNNTYFSNYSTLYDYHLKSDILKYTFDFDTLKKNNPSDLKSLENDTLVFNKKYKDEMNNSGIYDFKTYKTSLDKSEQLKRWGVNYTNTEDALLNEDKMQTSSIIDNTDKQLLNAIYAGYISQYVNVFYSSSTTFKMWLANVLNVQTTEKLKSAAFIEMLKNRLDNGEAPVMAGTFNNSGHAVNAISLAQDNEDSNVYHIGVYDNNNPGEKRYVDIKCNKNSCVTMKNNYYSNSNQPVMLNYSMEKDLEFLK